MTTRRRGITAALLLVGMMALLILLSGAVGILELKPGSYVPMEESGLRLGQGSPGEAVPLDWSWLWDLLRIVIPGTILLSIIGTLLLIRDPAFRKKVMPYLLALAAIVLIGFLATLFSGPISTEDLPSEEEEEPEITLERPTSDRTPSGWILDEAEPPIESMRWPILVSIVLAGVLFLIVTLPLAIFWRKRRLARLLPDTAEDIASIAAEAASEIAAGLNAVGVVQKCYVRMVRVLSQESNVRESFLTPREFAVVLRRKGFQSEDIDDLTHMFELVRYGERADETFADRAHRCLSRLGIPQEAPA